MMLGTGAAALAATAAPVLAAGVPALAGLPQRAAFEDLVGEAFASADGASLRLCQVLDGPQVPGLEQFSLVWEGGPRDGGLLELRHPRTGRFALHLEPTLDATSDASLRADLCLRVNAA
jgi:hypothetical protein